MIAGEEDRGVGRSGLAQDVFERGAQERLDVQLVPEGGGELGMGGGVLHVVGELLVRVGEVGAQSIDLRGDALS